MEGASISEDWDGEVTEDATTPNLSTTGTITFADVDKIDTHSVSAVADAGNTLGGTLTPVVTTDATGGVAGTVTWTYTVANNATDNLAVGQTATEKFTVTVSEGQGGTATQRVTITINGTNEAPTISGGSTTGTGAFSEAANPPAWTATDGANGSIAFADVDLSDAHTVSQAAPIFAWSGGTLSAGQISALTSASTLALTKTDSTGTGSGSVAWNYSAQDKTFDFLAAGQTLAVTYAVTVDDGHGFTTSQNVVVTVTGTNDAPVIGGVSTGAVTEDGPLTAGGALTITDVDSGQNHFLAVAPASLIGTYGTFTFDPNTGVWGYTLNKQAAESLPTGQVAHDKLTVTSADGSATKLIDVSITSTNDTPVIQGGVQSKVANLTANNGQLVFDGQLFFGDSDFTVSDPDGPHFGIAITSIDNAHGTWEYQLAGTTEWIPITLTITLTSGEVVPAWLLLSANDKVRFNGDASAPIETMQFKAWDGSGVFTNDGLIRVPAPADVGGSGAFSDGTYFAATKNDAPAGVAGEPINLGLADPSLVGYTVTVTIKDLPSDWMVNGGTHNADGSWTVQTADVTSLTVTTPASFAGAVLLTVTEAVVQADGTTTTFTLGDNIEAYTQGSPIFAWSDNDFLTGSTGNDLFVFSQPIGHDTVYSFDAAHDQIDLIGYAGFTSFADIQAHLADDANGDAVITLGDGQSIELQGVHAATLTDTKFHFNQTTSLGNAGTMTIGDGAMLPLSGTINNTGTIALNSTGDETDLQLIQHGVTLEGGGQILLSDSNQ